MTPTLTGIGLATGAGLALFVLAGAAMVAAIVALILWQLHVVAKRREALQAWATAHGFSFTEEHPGLEKDFRGFAPFGAGSSERCKNVLEGTVQGHPTRLFQYQYTVQSGKNSQTYVYGVLAVRMAVDGHDLTIQKEHIGHKLFDALGGEDIDFESDAFSRAFWVRCSDRRFAYDLLHPRMQEWLLANGQRHWQWRNGTLLLYQSGTLQARHLDPLLGQAFTFIGHLPRHRMPAEASV